jgi:proteasome lid subunit RPN8/RPN11
MTEATTLLISTGLAERIRKHGAESYPHECCGALLGRDAGLGGDRKSLREVLDCLPLVNRRDDSPNNRFSIAPTDVIEADRVAQARGMDLVGWYHSHPDHPPKPSEYDRNHAWPWFSYIIVSVRAGVPAEMTSWRLNVDRSEYSQEVIEIHSKAAAQS